MENRKNATLSRRCFVARVSSGRIRIRMCDTIVALGSATKEGFTIFGKNSDREPDEVQNIKMYPRQHHGSGKTVQCTYQTIPQIEETARIMVCQPFWMFGAEMGANEYGVIIGNEGLFTREKPSLIGLTGMDLLRLALEQSRSARQALENIITLIEKYGQGGNCGYRKRFLYMNSFLIADQREAYVLETVKSWWAWKQITDFWTISNIISLEQDFDACSPGLIENAIKNGYCRRESDFNFRECYSDRIFTWGAKGKQRQNRSRKMLSQKKGELTTTDIMAILRDHGDNSHYSPDKISGSICMHAANKLLRPSQSVCSLVGNVGEDRQLYWTTGAANPCLSPFYPIFFPDTTTPAGYIEGSATYNEGAFWWKSEKLHRRALCCFPAALDLVRPHIKQYEEEMTANLVNGTISYSQETIDKYFARVVSMVEEWREKLDGLTRTKTSWFFRRYWRNYNKINGLS